MKIDKSIALINVVSQIGAGKRARGQAWCDRIDFVKSYLETAGISVAEIITIKEPALVEDDQSTMRHLAAVVEVCTSVRRTVAECFKQGVFPVCLGGDHSLAIGSVAASAQQLAAQSKDLGLLWLDAHMDMNTQETTPSGNIHGMALATLCGIGPPSLVNLGAEGPQIKRGQAAAIGLRFADRSELLNLTGAGPIIISIRDVDRSGIAKVMKDVLPLVLTDTGGFHLSLDLDMLDPSVAPGVNTPFPGGMTFREVREICDIAASTGRMVSMDVVEHNPEMGDGKLGEVMLPIIAELIACALGASAMQ